MKPTRILLTSILLLTASAALAADFQAVSCEGTYPHHLQGVCTDEKDAIFWCFTTKLVKTDLTGKVVKQVDVANHYGDLCFHKGKVCVAVNLGTFNDPKGKADSWVYVYEASDLSCLAKHKTPEVFHGAGGIAFHDGKFLVVGGLPDGVNENYAYEYDGDFQFVKKHVLASGHTHLGIQTAAFADGHWWFGCYGRLKSVTAPATPPILLKADESLKKVERFEFDCSLGIVSVDGMCVERELVFQSPELLEEQAAFGTPQVREVQNPDVPPFAVVRDPHHLILRRVGLRRDQRNGQFMNGLGGDAVVHVGQRSGGAGVHHDENSIWRSLREVIRPLRGVLRLHNFEKASALDNSLRGNLDRIEVAEHIELAFQFRCWNELDQ